MVLKSIYIRYYVHFHMQENGCLDMIPLRGWPQDSDSQTRPKNNKGQWMSETQNLDNRGDFDNFEK